MPLRKGYIMKYCAYCGNSLQDDMQFCPKCGKKSAIFPTMIKPDEGQNCKQIEANIEDAPVSVKTEKEKQSRSGKRKTVAIAAVLGIAAVIALVCVIIFSRDFTKSPASIEKATESVVFISCYDRFGELRSTGSGFVMYDDSTIVTNYHVIDRALDIKISTDEDHTFSVEAILAYDQEKDIAILKTSEPTGLKCLSAGNSEGMKKGESVVAIGSPLGNKNTVSTGVLSGRLYNNENGVDELQFSAPISSGSSGGALFDKRGKIIGVTTATLVDGQNLNIAIPIETVEGIYANKKSGITLRECFEEVYKGWGWYYLSDENTFLKYNELVSKAEYYLGKCITTIAFVVPTGDGDYLAFATEDEARAVSQYDDTPVYFRPDEYSSCTIDKNYSGYVEICGLLRGYFGAYGSLRLQNLTKKAPGIGIDAKYFELLG